MKVTELLEFLEENSELDEIYVEDDSGRLHDLKVSVQPEVFDGFDSVYPACAKLTLTD